MSPKGDLVVSLTGLSDLASELTSIKSRMDDTGQVDRALGHGELGSDKALDALGHFMNGWKDGRKQIDGGLDSVAKMAQGIVDQLTKTDEDLKNALAKHENGKKS
jgi:archaellum component FlaC